MVYATCARETVSAPRGPRLRMSVSEGHSRRSVARRQRPFDGILAPWFENANAPAACHMETGGQHPTCRSIAAVGEMEEVERWVHLRMQTQTVADHARSGS